jgi:hypothetical protein
MKYEANPKHKEPWQPGRKGTLCPPMQDGRAQHLLEDSILEASVRYATDGEWAFAAQEHAVDRWHGYPVGFVEVPERVRRRWLRDGLVTRAVIRKRWTLDEF